MDETLQAEAAPPVPPPPPVAEPEPMPEPAEPMPEQADQALQVKAAVDAAIEQARPPAPPPITANVVATGDGTSVDFALAAPARCVFKFERTSGDPANPLPPGLPLFDRLLPAWLVRTDIVEDLNAEVPVLAPKPQPVDQDASIVLAAGAYELKLLDFNTCKFWVVKVS